MVERPKPASAQDVLAGLIGIEATEPALRAFLAGRVATDQRAACIDAYEPDAPRPSRALPPCGN